MWSPPVGIISTTWPSLLSAARVRLGRALLADLAAVGVVGARDVDAAAAQARLDVLGPVHLGGLHGVGGEAREDEHLLDGEARHHGLAAPGQRDPLAGAVADAVLEAVAGEPGHRQVALAEELEVVAAGLGAVARAEGVAGDEAVEVVEALVVTHVGHDVAVAVDDHVGALVLEAAHRGVLDRRRGRVGRVDLDDPAEPVGLVGVVRRRGVPARVDGAPVASVLRGGEAVAGLPRVGARGAEVLVEVLLARQHRAPRGGAAGAVVHGAADRATGRVGRGLEQVRPGGGTVDGEDGVEGDPAVEARARDVRPRVAALAAGQLDHGHAVRGPGRADEGGGVGAGREHDALVGVLVVAHEQGAGAGAVGLDDVEVVVVVAELPGLRLGRLVVRVEGRRAGQDRVAPAQDRVPAVAGRDRHVVDGGGGRRDRGEGEPRASGSAACRACCRARQPREGRGARRPRRR